MCMYVFLYFFLEYFAVASSAGKCVRFLHRHAAMVVRVRSERFRAVAAAGDRI